MSYFTGEFGGFKPHLDQDAAVKFVLDCIFDDARFDGLVELLTDGHEVGGLQGEPGWIVERRDSGASGEIPYYEGWPPGVSFRAYVDPESYTLTYSEMFLDEETFHRYLRAGLAAYANRHPENAALTETARSIVSR